MKLNLNAVIDLPRFYHQFNQQYNENEILNNIQDILLWCRIHKMPVIIHAIDVSDYSYNHNEWVPIFKGILPWKYILSFLIDESIPVKSIIFEYEDIDMSKKSVYSLRQWFNNL